MSIPSLSINRHVLAYMLSAVLALFGLIGYGSMGIDRFPTIEFPIIAITTTLKGANPSVVDSSITNIIENSINSVPGISHVQSQSAPGVSLVTVVFDLSKNIDVGFNEVQSKVNQVLSTLPKDADPPIVAKVQTGSLPVMWLVLHGDRTVQELNVYARNVIKKKLETIPGVGEVQLGGERKRVIRVNADPDRMSAYGVTTQDLIQAFNSEHFQLPGGFLTAGKTEELIKLDMEFHHVEDVGEMIVAYRNNAPIKLGDVATVEDGIADFRQMARFNGEPTVGIGIVKIPNSNTVQIVKEVRRRLHDEVIPTLPAGVHISEAGDDADFIQRLVDNLMEHLTLGTLLTAMVVWFFLRSFRATIIVSLAIPVSLLGSILVMYLSGYTFNMLTLLALLLLIGVVVDDAIVVLENIYRHREEIDPDPITAAVEGSNQVVFAVLAATMTLVSIFSPVMFLGGIIGRFFQSFAVVVTFGVLVSLFVSVTLTPMLCSRYLKVYKKHGLIFNMLEKFFRGMEKTYKAFLYLALRFRWLVVLVTIALAISSGYFLKAVGKGFTAKEDVGRFIVTVKTPLGSSVEYTDGRAQIIEKILRSHKEVADVFYVIGGGATGKVSEGTMFVTMISKEKRSLKQYDFIPVLNKEFAQVPGVQVFASEIPISGGMRGEDLQFILRGPDLNEVARLAGLLQSKLLENPKLGKVDMDLQLNLPEARLEVDRDRAANLGLSTRDVAMAVNVLAGGMDIAKYNDDPGDGERYDIRLKAGEGSMIRADDLKKIYLRSHGGELVRLDTVAKVHSSLGPAVIGRYDLQYSAQFFSNPTVPLGEAVNLVFAAASDMLPVGYVVKMAGKAEEFGKTVKYMMFTFGLALLLVYMVLASQFNSFIQPMVVMLAQPLAVVGGIFGLWATGHELNIFSMIGMVLLVGLVAKNSILLVDLTNQLRAGGKGIDEALKEACPIRMRPVLMTSLTIIFTLLPSAMQLGAGAESNAPMAVAIIGGMISSTLLTLVVVPSVYSLVEHGFERLEKRRKKKEELAVAEAEGV